MPFLRLFFLIVAVASFAASPRAEEASVDHDTDHRIGNWIASKDTCTITASFRNGKSLIVASDGADQLSLAIRSEHWDLPDGYTKTVLYWFNQDDPERGVARALDRHTLSVAIRDPAWIGAMLDGARDASFTFGDKTHRFPITHGSKASSWITHCSGYDFVRTRSGSANALAGYIAANAERQRNQPNWLSGIVSGGEAARFGTRLANAGPALLAGGEPPQKRVPGAEFMLTVLYGAGLSGFEVDTVVNPTFWGVRVNTVWTDGKRNGAVRRYKSMSSDLEYVETRRIRFHDDKVCRGLFSTEDMPNLAENVSGFVNQCLSRDGHSVTTRGYILVRVANGETYMVMTDETEPEAATGRVLDLAASVAKVAPNWN